jgi:hypothetical protein
MTAILVHRVPDTEHGVPPDDARTAAGHPDDTMKRRVLYLYRPALRTPRWEEHAR